LPSRLSDLYELFKMKKPIRVMMLVASLPPNKVGGAEMQALRLGKNCYRKRCSPGLLRPEPGKIMVKECGSTCA
jgi:hypothetical protein